MLAAALLVFLFDFTSFGVILLLGGSQFSTLEVEIYLHVLKLPNLPLAALLSVVQLVCTLIFSILYTRFVSRNPHPNSPRVSAPALKPKTIREKFFVFTFCSSAHCFFLPSSCLPPYPLPLPPRSRPWSARRSPIWIHHRLLQRTFHQSPRFILLCPANSGHAQFTWVCSLTVLLSLAAWFPAAYALAKPTRLEKILDPLIMLPLGHRRSCLGLASSFPFGDRLLRRCLFPSRIHSSRCRLSFAPCSLRSHPFPNGCVKPHLTGRVAFRSLADY